MFVDKFKNYLDHDSIWESVIEKWFTVTDISISEGEGGGGINAHLYYISGYMLIITYYLRW